MITFIYISLSSAHKYTTIFNHVKLFLEFPEVQVYVYVVNNHKLLETIKKPKSPSISYFLGFLWADGFITTRDSRYCVGLGIYSEDFLKYIDPILPDFKWSVKYHTQNGRKPQIRARIYSKELALYLSSLGFSEKEKGPQKVLSRIPEDLQKYWFRGFFDGDGCVYISRNKKCFSVDICGPYTQDWGCCEQLCRALNITKYSIKKNDTKYGKNSHFRIRNIPEILTFMNHVYDGFSNDHIGFTRKYEKFQQILHHYSPPSSIYKGLSKTPSNTWQVRKWVNGKNIYLGTFKSENDAKLAYNTY